MSTDVDFSQLIDTSISELENELYEHELAYLAMTSKVELPLRDKLAYILHKNVAANFFVAREWDRIDVAILDSHYTPHCLIEFKATNTQNGYGGIDRGEITHIKKHLKSLLKDLIAIEDRCNQVFGIFVGTHPTEVIQLNPAIKKIYQRPDRVSPAEMLNYYQNTIEKFFANVAVRNRPLSVKVYEIPIGEYYKVPIKLIIHLLRVV